MRGPSPTAALLMSASLPFLGGWMQAGHRLILLLMVLGLMAAGRPFRRRLLPVSYGLLLASFFVSLVCAGRIVGGAAPPAAIADAMHTLALASALWLSATVLLCSVPLEVALHWADRLRLPREVSYVPLSGLVVLASVPGLGARQVRLLELKDGGNRRITDRLRAYYKVSGPLFTILMSRQLHHVRSLDDRGYFTPSRPAITHGAALRTADVAWLGGVGLLFLLAWAWQGA